MNVTTWFPVRHHSMQLDSNDLEESKENVGCCCYWEQEWIPNIPFFESTLFLIVPRSWAGENIVQLYRLIDSILLVILIYGFVFFAAILK